MQTRGRAACTSCGRSSPTSSRPTPWLSGERLGALDILAATVSMWSGARKALAESRPRVRGRCSGASRPIRASPRSGRGTGRSHEPASADSMRAADGGRWSPRAGRSARACRCRRRRRRARRADQRAPRRDARLAAGSAPRRRPARWRRRRTLARVDADFGRRRPRPRRSLAAGYPCGDGDDVILSERRRCERGGASHRAAPLRRSCATAAIAEIGGRAKRLDAGASTWPRPLRCRATFGDWRAAGRPCSSSVNERAPAAAAPAAAQRFAASGAARLERPARRRCARAQPRHGRARLLRPRRPPRSRVAVQRARELGYRWRVDRREHRRGPGLGRSRSSPAGWRAPAIAPTSCRPTSPRWARPTRLKPRRQRWRSTGRRCSARASGFLRAARKRQAAAPHPQQLVEDQAARRRR